MAKITKMANRQRGVVIVLTAVAMFSLLLMAGLSLNSGHLMLSKTRLQNMLDAAALSAAKVLDETGDTVLAEQAGFAMLNVNLQEAGYGEIAASINTNGIGYNAEFSDTLVPFAAGGLDPQFVRLSLSGSVPLTDFFLMNNKRVNATAVSGASPKLLGSACDVAPMMACGTGDLVCSDPATPLEECENFSNFFGYAADQVVVMKYAAGDSSEIGVGNFHLVRLPGGQGGAAVRENMAGAFEGCMDNGEGIETEPGNTVGPVVQGLNTRFGEGGGGGLDTSVYPADHDSDYGADDGGLLSLDADGNISPDPASLDDSMYHSYSEYEGSYSAISDPDYCVDNPVCNRRVLTIPIGDCSVVTNGQGTVPLYGFGCFYLIQPVQQQGNQAQVYGQFVEGCTNFGSFDETPGTGPAPTRIILYKDPDSIDA